MAKVIDMLEWLRAKVEKLRPPQVVGDWATFENKDGKTAGEPLETGRMFDKEPE